LLKGEECPVLRFVKSRRATAGKGREIKCFGKIKEKTVSQFVYEGKVVCWTQLRNGLAEIVSIKLSVRRKDKVSTVTQVEELYH
jgi:hypothetical protein